MIEVGKGLGGAVESFKARVRSNKQRKAQKRIDRHREFRESAAPSPVAVRYNTDAFRGGWLATFGKPCIECGAPRDPKFGLCDECWAKTLR